MTTIAKPAKPVRGDSHTVAAIDRREVARLLRIARRAGDDERVEVIDWAFAACPESRQVQRLKIESLIACSDLDHANALIARALLLRPHDPTLSLLRARVLLARGQGRDADAEIQHALGVRREHVGTLRIAAEAARTIDDIPRAVSFLERALDVHPECDEVKADLVRTLLAAERIDRAVRVLQSMREPDPTLRATVLRAQGRRLEAIQLLEAAMRESVSEPIAADITCLLIDLLEETGSISRLRRVLDEHAARDHAVLLRAGRSWLALGQFRTAVVRLAPLRRTGRFAGQSLAIMLVASAMLGRQRFARRVLARLRRCPGAPNPPRLADLWRRALSARVLSDQTSPRTAGADRNTGLLAPLLRWALEVFDPMRRTEGSAPVGLTFADIARHRTLCLSALGLTPESGSPDDHARGGPAPGDGTPTAHRLNKAA
jgi:tetratricopeptide (TPR) repeat protein